MKSNFRNLIKSTQELKILKACDYLDNLRSFPYRTDRGERWQRHLREANEMYIPMAEATEVGYLIKETKKAYQEIKNDL